MNSVFVLLALAPFMAVLIDAHCRHHDRHCCRQKIYSGGCHRHIRRYAYNVSCGQCVPFDYSGCDGYDNNFESVDECNNCCRGTSPCPKYKLPSPPSGCHYKWNDGPDYCPRPKLDCHCPRVHCRPDSCRHGERCVPVHSNHCHQCPCRQYKCITDPCYPISRHLRPCEKCISLPAPKCHHHPCPLIAYKENHCKPHYHSHERRHHHHHCPHYFECPHGHDSCSHRRCPRHPEAKCYSDPCDCRKHWWGCDDGRKYNDDDCY